VEGAEDAVDARGRARLHAAALPCESCGRTTPHRILRLDRSVGPAVRGLARCRECQLTHPFESAPEAHVSLSLIVSTGPTSERTTLEVPSSRSIQVGSGVPGSSPPLTIHRIEDHQGNSPSRAAASEVRTLWATRDEGAVVAVSVVAGRLTHSERLALPHGTRLCVGDPLELGDGSVTIVGLRARGKTWRRPGDEFSADEVTRVYARRTSIPPAGSRPWSRVRERPRSRERAVSIASRSRSSPGTRRARIVPRARIADAGAAVQS
jgi:uncharacterized Zn finger protein